MYVYDFKPTRKAINSKEIFVVMPFASEYDDIYNKLIDPAVKKANQKLGNIEEKGLKPFRTKDDPKMTSGWINILEHILTAQIVLGVLTGDNLNVFYELGIAHATQPKTRQILIASKGYEPKFDTKDLIYYQYEDDIGKSIEPLSDRIIETIKAYKIEEEKKIHQARMLVGPYEFEILMIYNKVSNFAIHTGHKREYDEKYGQGAFEKHIPAITGLCQKGLLGLNTNSELNKDGNGVGVEFSYWWTSLGNLVLNLMKLINKDETCTRNENLPKYFE